MRYLTSALISEGVSDDAFLPRLLTRALTELCAVEFGAPIDVADVQPLRRRGGPPTVDQAIDLVDAYPRSYLVVFFHRDQGGSADRVRREWLDPLRARWGDRAERLVAVVPVRETEAWLLADGDAIRRALGVPSWTDAQLGLPRSASDVERLPDPKKVVEALLGRVSRRPEHHLSQLGELVSLGRLSEVPAFTRWWSDTRDALLDLGFR
ncbi:MAG TPA: DUF4276 family protein [Pilimelia sp.]|nr:DUF4276 family protein [Pilimelia sp.]